MGTKNERTVEMADEEQKRQISCKNIEAFYLGPARQKQKRPLWTACYRQYLERQTSGHYLFMKRTNITIGLNKQI
jgi:hypothetical protein